MDRHMLSLHPMHNHQIIFFNLKPQKDELHSRFLARIMDEASIAEIGKLTPEAMMLHIFCHSTPHSESGKPVRKLILERLRNYPNLKEIETTLASIKGIESDNLAQNTQGTQRPNTARRAANDGKCYVCDSKDHLKYNCPVKCLHCSKKGHKSADCFTLRNPPNRAPSKSDNRGGHGE